MTAMFAKLLRHLGLRSDDVPAKPDAPPDADLSVIPFMVEGGKLAEAEAILRQRLRHERARDR